MKVSIFNGTNEKQMSVAVSEREIEWNELPSFVTQMPWSPATFKDRHRLKVNAEQISFFVGDVDEGLTIEDAKRLFASYRCIIGTSKSHQIEKVKPSGEVSPPCDRYRILIQTERPMVSDAELKATFFDVVKLCPQLDPACKDASRFFWPCKEIVWVNEGATIPVGVVNKGEQKQQVNYVAPGTLGKLSRRTNEFLANGAPNGQWHHELVAACLDMKQQNWSKDKALTVLPGAAYPNDLDAHDESTVDDIWNNRTPKHPPRFDNNDNYRNVINRSHLIIDASEPKRTAMVDLTIGQIYGIKQGAVSIALNKDEMKEFMKSRRILAEFGYEPYEQGQLTVVPKTGLNLFNVYQPPQWKADWFFHSKLVGTGTIPPLYDEFFAHLTNGDTASKEYLFDWLAYSLKGRNQTVLTAIGKQGIGKGVLGHIMETMHGDENFVHVRDEVFKNRFNGRLADVTLVYVDEADLRTKESQDRFKVVVNKKIEVEEKGLEARTITNHASYYLTSNSFDAVKIEPGDRRFSIIELTDVPLKDTPFIKRLMELMDPVNVEQLALGLWNRTVGADMLTPYKGARADDVMEAGLTDWEQFVVFEWAPMNAGRTFTLRELQDAIKGTCNFRTSPGRRKIQELADKYPAVLRLVQDRNNRGTRLVEALGKPMERRLATVATFTAT